MDTDKILDGKKLANDVKAKLAERALKLSKKGGRAPGLGVILVGDDEASKVYVGNKRKYAEKCNFISKELILPKSSAQDEVHQAIETFNKDSEIDGILLQLPLPKHLDSNLAIGKIRPEKDADGLHPINQGLMAQNSKFDFSGSFSYKLAESESVSPGYTIPCTPKGIMALLSQVFVNMDGLTAVVVGRSVLVGKPMACLLTSANCTVTLAHSRTKDLDALLRGADIVVACCGVPQMIKVVKEGSTVIDVGINRVDGKLVGDVDFHGVVDKTAYITKVPGGVGPMTVAMLMDNCLQLYAKRMLD